MAKIVHAIVRTDLMQGTYNPTGLVSVRYMGSGNTETEIDNGNFVLLNGNLDGEREIYKGVTPAADSNIENVVLLAAPELMSDEHKKNMNEFYNEAGAAIRGYRLYSGNIFSLTAEAFDGTPAKGKIVELQAKTKLKVVASATAGSTVVGEIFEEEIEGTNVYFAIRIK
ncbi:MAG: hypothetical protein RR370_01810 [Synergistaceae bacterium]